MSRFILAGPRVCVDMQLAYCELYCMLGTLFRRFENLEAWEVGQEDLVSENYFGSFHPLDARKFRVVSKTCD